MAHFIGDFIGGSQPSTFHFQLFFYSLLFLFFRKQVSSLFNKNFFLSLHLLSLVIFLLLFPFFSIMCPFSRFFRLSIFFLFLYPILSLASFFSCLLYIFSLQYYSLPLAPLNSVFFEVFFPKMPFFILWNENSLKFLPLAKFFYTAFYRRSLFYPRTWELGSECVKIKGILTVLTAKCMWRVLRAQAECEWCVRDARSVDESLNCIWIDFIREGLQFTGWTARRMIFIHSSQMKCWDDNHT